MVASTASGVALGPVPMVAVIGRANVGKSTLFNALLRSRRALVEDRPGVTRDRLVAPAEVEGREVLLVDTGGLDPDAEAGLPAAVRAQVHRALEDAAVILFVVDVRAGVVALDHTIAELLRKAERQVVVVVNKCDGPKQELGFPEFHALGFSEVIPISAEHRRNLTDLEIAIAERLPAPAEREAEPDGAVRVAIVGRPNAGKSSLVNRLVGEGAAVVSEAPGTTRDATDHRLAVGDAEVVLIDTAGLRRAGRRDERLERGSALMALRSIERADVAILVVDASAEVAEQDARIARLAVDRGCPLVIALNKWDLVAEDQVNELERTLERRLRFIQEPVIRRVSALSGQGTRRLLPAALELHAESRREIATHDVNRLLAEAVKRLPPPVGNRRRARLYYATQVSQHPFTVLVFASNPDYIPENYRRYLESFFRKRLGIRSSPVRVRFRARRETDEDAE